MKTAEDKFIESAEKNMIEFEIAGFKRTYPHLFKTIIEAMEEYASQFKGRRREGDMPLAREMWDKMLHHVGSYLEFEKKYNEWFPLIASQPKDQPTIVCELHEWKGGDITNLCNCGKEDGICKRFIGKEQPKGGESETDIEETRKIVSAQQYALKNCEDNMSCLTKVKQAYEKGFDDCRKYIIPPSKGEELLQEAIYLLHVKQPDNCQNWIEGVGDCNRAECEFCRIQRCIDKLESNSTPPSKSIDIEELVKWIEMQKNIDADEDRYTLIKKFIQSFPSQTKTNKP